MGCYNFCNDATFGGSSYVSGTTCAGVVGAYTLNLNDCICMDLAYPYSCCDNPKFSGECNPPSPSPTATNTPTVTPSSTQEPICPEEISLFNSQSNLSAYTGNYQRLYSYSGGTFNHVWYDTQSSTWRFDTADSFGNNANAYGRISGGVYYTLYAYTTVSPTNVNIFAVSSGTTSYFVGTLPIVFNPLVSFLTTETLSTIKYPPRGLTNQNNFYVSYPELCPTATPTQTPTLTPTNTPTSTQEPICPEEITISSSTLSISGYNGNYQRLYSYSGGSFNHAYYSNTIGWVYDTADSQGTYSNVYGKFSSGVYYTLFGISSTIPQIINTFGVYSSTTSYGIGINVIPGTIIVDVNPETINSVKYPSRGNTGSNNFYVSYPELCPTATPTQTPTATNTPTPSVTPICNQLTVERISTGIVQTFNLAPTPAYLELTTLFSVVCSSYLGNNYVFFTSTTTTDSVIYSVLDGQFLVTQNVGTADYNFCSATGTGVSNYGTFNTGFTFNGTIYPNSGTSINGLSILTYSSCITPSPTPTVSNTATPTNTPTVSNSNTPTNTPTVSNTATPTNTPTVSNTATPTNTPTVSLSNTPTNTPTVSNSATPTNTPTWTPTPSPTTPVCNCYLFFNEDSVSSTIHWKPCGGSATSATLGAGQTVEHCCDEAYPPFYTGGVTTIVPCTSATTCLNDGDCTNCT